MANSISIPSAPNQQLSTTSSPTFVSETLTTGLVTPVLSPDTTNAHTLLVQGYDVDGTAYKTFATVTNGNTPDLTVAPPSGGTVTLQATTFKSSDGTSGATAGPFTTVASISVKNGLVTVLTGS